MLQRLLVLLAIVAFAASFTAGCKSPARDTRHDGRVVIVYAADRAASAVGARDNLRELGFRVHIEPEGPSVRTSSMAAVYEAGRHEGRVEAVEQALELIPGVEVRPFFHSGPEGTAVVVWLVSHERESGPPSPLPEAAPGD